MALINETAMALGDLYGSQVVAYYPGNFIEGEPVAGIVQFTQDDTGRRVLTGLFIVGGAITSDVLRKVPVQQLESAHNMTEVEARERLGVELAALPPLRREPGMSPEDFSRLVADHYRAWAKAVPHPASAMAEAVKVKPPTMHTWIREARLRGFLPETTRKKTAREMWERATAARDNARSELLQSGASGAAALYAAAERLEAAQGEADAAAEAFARADHEDEWDR